MVKKLVLPLIIVTLLFALSSVSLAAENRVFDNADLFSDEEEAAIQKKIDTFAEKTGYDCVVVTASDLGGKTSQAYADDFYDQTDSGGKKIFGYDEAHSGILYLIDMENRLQTVSTTGDMIDYISDTRLELLFDAAGVPLSDGDYAKAAEKAIVTAQVDVKGDGLTILEVLFALGAGFITAFAIKKGISNDYELKGGAYFYDVNSLSRVSVLSKNDTFLRQSVVHRPKAPPPSSSGGSRGGSSVHMGSSGTSHGGGSRGF